MNELRIFNYEGAEVRMVQKDGEPWWVAKDVCDVFGESNRNRAMQALEEDEKGYTQMTTPRGVQQMAVVNEAGLYSLLFAMQPTKARGVSEEYILERETKLKSFRRWVTHEVLPSIRKHGMYAVDEVLDNPDMLISALTSLKEERAKRKALESETAQQKQMLAEYSPKASYYDVVLQTTNALSVSQIAKDYGKSAKWLNKYLHSKGIQYKQGDIWLLYQKYAEQGYTKSKTSIYTDSKGTQLSKLHTYWTQKGRLFIYDLLKQDGILPLVEREDDAIREHFGCTPSDEEPA